MDFGNTPATRLTERIMAEIKPHLKDDAPGQPTHYNRVYAAIHRQVLAEILVGNIAKKYSGEAARPASEANREGYVWCPQCRMRQADRGPRRPCCACGYTPLPSVTAVSEV